MEEIQYIILESSTLDIIAVIVSIISVIATIVLTVYTICQNTILNKNNMICNFIFKNVKKLITQQL